jgi:hypothetical protein
LAGFNLSASLLGRFSLAAIWFFPLDSLRTETAEIGSGPGTKAGIALTQGKAADKLVVSPSR